MKLQNTFMSKLIFIALAGISFPQLSLAQHHSYQSDAGNQWDSHLETVTEQDFKQLELALQQNPGATLDKVTEFVNKKFKVQQNGMSKFQIAVKYHSRMPIGETAYFEIVQNEADRVTLQLNVREAVKSNPIFLLDALVKLRSIYNLNSISYNGDAEEVYGHKKHPNHSHGPFLYLKYTEYSLKKSLGLPTMTMPVPQAELSPMELLEVSANAAAGSVFAQRRLSEMATHDFEFFKRGLQSFLPLLKLSESSRQSALSDYFQAKGFSADKNEAYENRLKNYIDQTDLQLKKTVEQLNGVSKKVYRQQVDTYKSRAGEREQIVKGTALNEMIKANDRKGVAEAMEKMLPWEIMEPSEKIFWRGFVDSIRNPDYRNAQILFRGMDADEKFQAITDKSGKIVGGGLLSKRLTAGSGSHFFKLKGLPETFETFGTYGVWAGNRRVSPLNQPHTLTKMMINHATNPNGSPFISLTYSINTAYNFGQAAPINASTEQQFDALVEKSLKANSSGGLATIRIDPRRLLVNSVSTYSAELEVLASMFIFPDEVLHLEKGVQFKGIINDSYVTKMKLAPEDYYARARQSVFEKTGVLLPESHYEYERVGQKNFVNGIKNLEVLYNQTRLMHSNRCELVFR